MMLSYKSSFTPFTVSLSDSLNVTLGMSGLGVLYYSTAHLGQSDLGALVKS